MQWISPFRYLNELLFRRMLAGRSEIVGEGILEDLGFTWGVPLCSFLMGNYIVCAFLLGWFLTFYLAKGL